MKEYICKQNAYRYFWPELDGKCKKGWVLHHKNPSWKIENPIRYHQWNIEDLIPMTIGQHVKWHAKNDKEWLKNVVKKGENNPMFGHHLSSETKQKLSEAKKGKYSGEKNPFFGKHHSEGTKKKISEAMSGEKNPMFGKFGENHQRFGHHLSDETKRKLSKSLIGKLSGEKNPMFGKHWYNNGEINVLKKECPSGFVKGRLILNK